MNNLLDQLGNHLEFLGYKIEKQEPKADSNRLLIIASHSKNNNIVLFEMSPGFVLLKVSLTTQRKPTPEMDAFINEANKKFDISKFYYDVDSELAIIRFEAIYTGIYSKELFGQFVDFFQKDQDRLGLLDNFSKIFLD